jgi:hypothetical protein
MHVFVRPPKESRSNFVILDSLSDVSSLSEYIYD